MFYNPILSANPIIEAYHVSDLFGKFIFLSLFALSIVTWILFLQKFTYQRRARAKSAQIARAFDKESRAPLSLNLSKHNQSPFALLYRTLKEQANSILSKNHYFSDQKKAAALSHTDIEMIEAHLATEISTQTKALEKNLFVLNTIVSLAPFLGLLGTVWGILLTFNQMQLSGGGGAGPEILGGLSMALGTTVLGLVVAIFSLIAANVLRNSIRYFVSDMEDFSAMALSSVEMHYRRVDP